MPDQQVPWAVGRRALVLDVAHTGGWVEVVGVTDSEGAQAWRAGGEDDDGEPWGEWWVSTICPTELLPDQCPRCFEVSAHAPGCMVAANLARGVSEFWAPVVMPIAPPVGTGFALYLLRTDGALVWLDRADSANAWVLRARLAGLLMRSGEGGPNALHVGFVALGPNGPTLEPWSKS